MTRQPINIGTTANDGTGDTLRTAGDKINDNFTELYTILGGHADTPMTGVSFDSAGIIFEGTLADAHETFIRGGNPSTDIRIDLPTLSGTLIVDSGGQTIKGKTLDSATSMINPYFQDSAAAVSKYQIEPGALQASHAVSLPVITAADQFTFNSVAQTISNKTLADPIIQNPIIHGGIEDSAGQELINLFSTSSAVNELRIQNAATATMSANPAPGPKLSVSGDDTHINMILETKGNGTVAFLDPQRLGNETLTSSTAISVNVPLTIINAGGATSMTMGDGYGIGHVKSLLNKGAGRSTITPSNLAGSKTTIALNQYASIDCVWEGSNWYVRGLDSADGHGNLVILA